MSHQVAPIEIYVKRKKETNKQKQKNTHLFAVQKHPLFYTFVSATILMGDVRTPQEGLH